MNKAAVALLLLTLFGVLCIVFLSGCVATGTELASPVNKTLDHASVSAQNVYATGSAPKDFRVKSIITDIGTAKKQVAAVTVAYDKEKAAHEKDRHQLVIIYWILAGCGAILAAPMVMKILPLLAL